MSRSLPTSGVTSQTKKCAKCEIEKPLTDFYRYKRGKFGVQSYCKVCDAICNRAYEASPRGKQVRRAILKKYQKTGKGIAANERYRFSDKGRLINLLYKVEARDNKRRLTG